MSSIPEGRVPPQNIDAEESVLGAILLKNEAIDEVEYLEPGDFYRQKNQLVFSAMQSLNEAKEPIDLVTLATALKEGGALESVGGEPYLAELAGRVPTAANIPHYGRKVLQCSELRSLIHDAQDIEALAYERDAEAAKTKADAIGLRQGRGQSRLTGRLALARAGIAHVEKVGSRAITGVPTGFLDLDFKTAGLQPGDLVILAARPSMGKTSLALNIGDNAAQAGFPVFMASAEMSTAQVALRLACSGAGLDSEQVRRDADAAIDAFHRIGELPLYVDDTAGPTVGQVRAGARKVQRMERALIEKNGMGLVIVDYLQLLNGGKHNNRNDEVAAISRGLKALAKDLNWPVLALSQLNRGVESRQDKRPNLGDLRESGQIEQDADIVAFIYRDHHYNPGADPRHAELNISKNRNGGTGSIDLNWCRETTTFSNWSNY